MKLLKKYGFINFMTNRLDAIYFMQQELTNMVEQGIFEKSDKEYLTAQLILRREERIEKEKLNG